MIYETKTTIVYILVLVLLDGMLFLRFIDYTLRLQLMN